MGLESVSTGTFDFDTGVSFSHMGECREKLSQSNIENNVSINHIFEVFQKTKKQGNLESKKWRIIWSSHWMMSTPELREEIFAMPQYPERSRADREGINRLSGSLWLEKIAD